MKINDYQKERSLVFVWDETGLTDVAKAALADHVFVDRLASGDDVCSSLYSYRIAVCFAAADTSCDPALLLGRRVSLLYRENRNKVKHAVSGIVAELEPAPELKHKNLPENVRDCSCYLITVRPSLYSACFTRRRRVYAGMSPKAAIDKVLSLWGIASIWTVDAAGAANDPCLQCIQGDESDYNFMVRLMRAWGFGFYWQQQGYKPEDDMSSPKAENMVIFKVAGDSFVGVSNLSSAICVEHVNISGEKNAAWKKRFGYVPDAAQVAVENYYGKDEFPVYESAAMKIKPAANAAMSVSTADRLVTLASCMHDHLQYTEKTEYRIPELDDAAVIGRYLASHNGADVCHVNQYAEVVCVGHTARFALSKHVAESTEYRVTKISACSVACSLDGGKESPLWVTNFYGRNERGKGIGILPGLLEPIPAPDLDINLDKAPDKDLLQAVPGKPVPRYFLAKVVGTDLPANNAGGKRNLCLVQEVCGVKYGTVDHPNEMWVELGSPFADADSGLLARPRKGNVLLCLDRGDLSIPIVLTSLFRDGNNPPVASLSGASDTTAVTLRNRSIKDGTSSAVADMTPYSVPRSVHSLCTDKPLCSQIQLIGKDNNIVPQLIDSNLGSTYAKNCAFEVVSCIALGINTAGSMAGAIAPNAKAGKQMDLKPRTHFQGINMYSEKDVLLQSTDSQFINAGGIINITAAAGITLRVGRNAIVISESGIEMISGNGNVENPGAHSAYNSTGGEKSKIVKTYSSSISLNQTGTIVSGVNTKLCAVNDVRMEVAQGGVMELNNFEATISAPHTKVIGGAAIANTLTYGLSGLLLGVSDLGMSLNAHSDDAQGRRDQAAAGVATSLDTVGFVGGIRNTCSRFMNCISVTGSLIDLAPRELLLASQKTFNESVQHHIYTNPISGLRALGETNLGGILNLIGRPTLLFKLSTNQDERSITKSDFVTIQADETNLKKKGITMTKNDTWIKSNGVGIQAEATVLETKATNITAGNNIVSSQSQSMTNHVRFFNMVDSTLLDNTVHALVEMHATIGNDIGTRINA